jgi:hypothetical protein
VPLGKAGEAAGQPRLPGRLLVRQELQAQREHPQRYTKKQRKFYAEKTILKDHCVLKILWKKRSEKILNLREPPFYVVKEGKKVFALRMSLP